MSQFHDASSEPKKQFLNMLIQDHFQLSNEVHTSQSGTRVPILRHMTSTATMIIELLPETDQKIIQQLQEQIEKIIETDKLIERKQLQNMFQTLTSVIARNLYGEIKTGLIPSNTMATQTDRPKQQYANPNQTAKI